MEKDGFRNIKRERGEKTDTSKEKGKVGGGAPGALGKQTSGSALGNPLHDFRSKAVKGLPLAESTFSIVIVHERKLGKRGLVPTTLGEVTHPRT